MLTIVTKHNSEKNRINILHNMVKIMLNHELDDEEALNLVEFSELIAENIYKYFNGSIRGVFNNSSNSVILYSKIDNKRRAIFYIDNKPDFKIKPLKWFGRYLEKDIK